MGRGIATTLAVLIVVALLVSSWLLLAGNWSAAPDGEFKAPATTDVACANAPSPPPGATMYAYRCD